MFSSTSNNNTLMSPFPQYYFPSSSPYQQLPQPHPQLPLPPPPPLPPSVPLLNQNDNIFLHQNHQYDQVLFSLAHAQIPAESGTSLINLGVSNSSRTTTTNNINIMTNTTTTTTKQDVIINGDFVPRKPVKKDRHSKIYTAHGLRDRRVRLSIDIAREFFDLHDMLGFDKASKTLEWLLTKSKKAIKDLSRSKSKMMISSTPTATTTLFSTNSECEQADFVSDKVNELVIDAADDTVSPDHNNLAEKEDDDEEGEEEAMLKERIEMESLSESALLNLLAKESRAKARARARARTKEKRHNYNCSTSPYNKRSKNVEKCGSGSQISNQFFRRPGVLNQLDQDRAAQKRPNLEMETQDHHHHQPVVMIKRKLKFPSISTGYNDDHDHHNQGLEFCGISKGETSSNNVMIYSSSPTSLLLTQNWDNINNMVSTSCTASPHPVFCLPT